jgi:hypothetical protein
MSTEPGTVAGCLISVDSKELSAAPKHDSQASRSARTGGPQGDHQLKKHTDEKIQL